MRTHFAALLAASSLAAACVPVQGERITAGDVAASLPAFATLPPETVLGWAPAVGVERVVEAPEIERWARRHSLRGGVVTAEESRLAVRERDGRERDGREMANPVTASNQAAGHQAAGQQAASKRTAPLCLKRSAAPLQTGSILAALRTAAPGWGIELLDWPRGDYPVGRLEFSRSVLPRPPRTVQIQPGKIQPGGTRPGEIWPVTWRGVLAGSSGRRYPVWARVRLSEERVVIEATEALAAGEPLEPARLRRATREEYPLWPVPLTRIEETHGHGARRPIPAGRAVLASDLAPLPAIRRGDMVTLEVISGNTRLQLEVKAEANAQTGQTVLLKNSLNGRRFPARVIAPGKAVAIASSRPELP